MVSEIRVNDKPWFTVSPEFSRIFVRQVNIRKLKGMLFPNVLIPMVTVLVLANVAENTNFLQ